jgi:hypothetical protein
LIRGSIGWYQDKLFTFQDIEDVEVQENFVMSHLEGHSMENSLTFHDLAVDPLQVLTREGQGLR